MNVLSEPLAEICVGLNRSVSELRYIILERPVCIESGTDREERVARILCSGFLNDLHIVDCCRSPGTSPATNLTLSTMALYRYPNNPAYTTIAHLQDDT
jgi:hypothetical protein